MRGTTIVEYIFLLVIILVIVVVAYKALGWSVSRKVGVASKAASGETSGNPEGTAAKPASGGATATPTGGPAPVTYSAYDESGQKTAAASDGKDSTSMLGKFALLIIGVLGAAAAFFAIMKAKHSTPS